MCSVTTRGLKPTVGKLKSLAVQIAEAAGRASDEAAACGIVGTRQSKAAEPMSVMLPGALRLAPSSASQSTTWFPFLSPRRGMGQLFCKRAGPVRVARRGKVFASRMSCATFRIFSANGSRASLFRSSSFMVLAVSTYNATGCFPALSCRGRPAGAVVRCEPCLSRGRRWRRWR